VSIDQSDVIDAVTIEKASGEIWLTISDHLSWEEEETHLQLLRKKLDTYRQFVDSGGLVRQIPAASSRPVVIDLVGKFPPSQKGALFFEDTAAALKAGGYRLQFRVLQTS
jgi:hypothetical protein